MGDEKEAVMGQLQTERRQYEKQVVQLVNQQEQILTEREGNIYKCNNFHIHTQSQKDVQVSHRERVRCTGVTER